MSRTLKARRQVFPPDAILPSQFFVTLRSQTPPKPPEYRLLIAILEDAVACFQKHVRAKRRCERQFFQEAEQWIMGGNEQDDSRLHVPGLAFSFSYVCEALGIEPDYLRQGLQQWRDAQLSATAERPNLVRGRREQK